jgi:hypothetical protein
MQYEKVVDTHMSDRATENSGNPDQHILFQDGKWSIIPEGASDPIRVFDTREEALRWAGRSLNHQGATLVVHNEDGSINDTIRPQP